MHHGAVRKDLTGTCNFIFPIEPHNACNGNPK